MDENINVSYIRIINKTNIFLKRNRINLLSKMEQDIICTNDHYFKLKKPKDGIYIFGCNLTKYEEIIKKYFNTPRHFSFNAGSVLKEIFHQNLDNLIWKNQEMYPDLNKSPDYLTASIPYSHKGIEVESYEYYRPFCTKRTLKKYLKILEEIGFLKIGETKNNYIQVYDIHLKKWVNAIKEHEKIMEEHDVNRHA